MIGNHIHTVILVINGPPPLRCKGLRYPLVKLEVDPLMFSAHSLDVHFLRDARLVIYSVSAQFHIHVLNQTLFVKEFFEIEHAFFFLFSFTLWAYIATFKFFISLFPCICQSTHNGVKGK